MSEAAPDQLVVCPSCEATNFDTAPACVVCGRLLHDHPHHPNGPPVGCDNCRSVSRSHVVTCPHCGLVGCEDCMQTASGMYSNCCGNPIA